MVLPIGGNNVPWPPLAARPELARMAEHDAWYSGDAERLAKFYEDFTRGMSDASASAEWWRFYRRNQATRGQRSRAALHVPLPGDIAGLSAAMLFGEEPEITIPDAHEDATNATAEATERRLLEICDEAGLYAKLIEAAEQASALGGVYLKIAWDDSIAGHPFIEPVQADAAIPEWKFGRLRAVTFWRVVEKNGQKWTRHLERYEPGAILHGLYRGSETSLGERIPLESHDSTRDLREAIALPEADMLAVRYVPNMRPNRRDRGSQLGQSDYAGSEGLFDALDETYTSWMRDLRLAKARLVVPQEWLTATPSANGTTSVRFDLDQEVFSPMNIEPGDEHGGVTLAQFAIRAAEHETTATNLIERIVSSAGYSPQTFGLEIEGRAESGTALRIREKRTIMTRNRKALLWQSPLGDMLHMLLVCARALFNDTEIDPNFRPDVEIKDGLPDDPSETIQSVALLRTAGAASTQTLVSMLHPEWDQDAIDGEVKRIRDEEGMNVPDPAAFTEGA